MDIKEAKKELRSAIRKKEKTLPGDYKEFSNIVICQKIMQLESFLKARTVFLFIPMKSEVDIRPVIEYAWARCKNVIVPLCMPEGQMSLRKIKSFADLEPGAYGILEPKKYCEELDIEDLDFTLVPCVSCSSDGRRLGNGGGYYDRFLEKFKGEKAILCRKELMSEDIPMEPFDATVLPVIHD